jgi:hypothetical protein
MALASRTNAISPKSYVAGCAAGVTPMKSTSSVSVLVFIVVLGIGLGIAYAMHNAVSTWMGYGIDALAFVVAFIVSSAVQVANQWDRAVVLRMGRFQALRGPGLFFIIPIVDAIVYWVDMRVITMSFKAEKTLTKDTVPVDVDAVLFWKVLDPKKVHWMSPTIKRPSAGPARLPCATSSA